MANIDERILGMKFDNRQFESGIQTSITSLNNLENKLKMGNATQGLESITKASKNMNFDSVGKSLETISSKFTALGIIGVTVLQNIANQAIQTGVNLFKSISTDRIMDGFREYEVKMGSIQTILANTAKYNTGLPEVVSSLDKLNEYADLTIYSFGDMTRNIGLFTNAGINIQDATNMVKGFSNEAAASGTTSNAAAGAAYQLSQALSAGTIRLMDWRSLTNVGMGNKNMQQGIIEVAEAMGTFTNSGISAEEASTGFNQSLEKGWLTSEVMSNYLKIMANDQEAFSDEQMRSLGLTQEQIDRFRTQAQTAQDAATKVRTFTQLIGTIHEAVGSSWAETFDIILGDFDQATELFTRINDTLSPIIGGMGDARNALLQEWANMGGRTALIESLFNALNGILSVMTPIHEAFKSIIPPITAEHLVNISKGLQDFTSKMVIGTETAWQLKQTFRGVFSILDLGRYVIKTLAEHLLGLVKNLIPSGNGFLEFASNVGLALVSFNKFVQRGDFLGKTLSYLGDGIGSVVSKIKSYASNLSVVGDWFNRIVEAVKSIEFPAIEDVFSRGADSLEPLKVLGQALGNIFKQIANSISSEFPGILNFAKGVADGLKKLSDGIRNTLKGLDAFQVTDIINTAGLMAFGYVIIDFIRSLTSTLKSGDGFIKNISGAFTMLTDTLGAMQANLKASALIKIAAAIGILALSLLLLSTIDSDRLTSALAAISVLFVGLSASMAGFQKMIAGMDIKALTGASLGILAISAGILMLSGAVKILSGIEWEGLAKGLIAVSVLMGVMIASVQGMQGHEKGLISAGIAMGIFGISLRIMAGAVEKLGSIDLVTLAKGLGSVIVLMTTMSIVFSKSDLGSVGVRTGLGLLAIAGAMHIFASAISKFGEMDMASIGKGLGSIAVLLLEVSAFSHLVNPTKMIATATSLAILGGAMLIFQEVVDRFGSMDLLTLAKGLGALAISLGIIAGASKLMSGSEKGALAMGIVAVALLALSKALNDLGGMSWEEIARGLVVLAGSLGIIAAALMFMSGSLSGAAALAIVSAALSLLIPPLISLGGMSWGEIARGLAMLAGAFAVIGLAGVFLGPLVPVLLGLAGAIALFGLGALAAGAGVLALSAGLSALAVAGVAGAAALVVILTSIIGLIPMFMSQFAQGLLAFADVLAAGGPTLIAAFTTLLMSLITAVVTVTPAIIDALKVLLTALLDAVIELAPKFAKAAIAVIRTLLDAVVTITPDILNAIAVLLTAMVKHIISMTTYFVDAAMRLLSGFLQGIADRIGDVITAGANIIIAVLDGIGREVPRISQAAIDLVIDFTNSLAGQISASSGAMRAAAANLGFAIIDGITGGLASRAQSAYDKASEIASTVLSKLQGVFNINSPSKETWAMGEGLDEGLEGGMYARQKHVSAAATSVGKTAIHALAKTLEDAEKDHKFEPTIKPVVDMTNVDNAMRYIAEPGVVGVQLINGPDYRMGRSLDRDIEDAKRASREPVFAETSPASVNVNYNQVLNSPKALDRLEIYRDTRNQLAMLREALRG